MGKLILNYQIYSLIKSQRKIDHSFCSSLNRNTNLWSMFTLNEKGSFPLLFLSYVSIRLQMSDSKFWVYESFLLSTSVTVCVAIVFSSCTLVEGKICFGERTRWNWKAGKTNITAYRIFPSIKWHSFIY